MFQFTDRVKFCWGARGRQAGWHGIQEPIEKSKQGKHIQERLQNCNVRVINIISNSLSFDRALWNYEHCFFLMWPCVRSADTSRSCFKCLACGSHLWKLAKVRNASNKDWMHLVILSLAIAFGKTNIILYVFFSKAFANRAFHLQRSRAVTKSGVAFFFKATFSSPKALKIGQEP